MKPFFFGPPTRPLFGAYDGPAARAAAPRGLVVAYPMGQESLRAHRALRRLALRLARGGFHTLRFDYWGTGDSGGESEDGEIGQWIADVAAAVDEMKMLQALDRVSLLGLRLGAALAAVVGAGRSDIDRLVLWEPVVDGRAYLRECLAAHRNWLDSQPISVGSARSSEDAGEMLGFPLTPALRAGIEALDLLSLGTKPAARVFVVEREQKRETREFCQRLAGLGADVDYEHVPEPAIWMRREMDQTTVPPQTLERVAAWLGRGEP